MKPATRSDTRVSETDVADPTSVTAAITAVDSTFGTVHVCVNAAGVPTAGKIVTNDQPLPLEAFWSVIEVTSSGASTPADEPTAETAADRRQR